jgi:methylphosphotriester-DNA--protein-cysteine methyltransferase
MSRSSFAATFRRLTGQAPFSYLTDARMRIAAAEIARGRSSEGGGPCAGLRLGKGFRDAFKKVIGRSPGTLKPPRAAADHSGDG